MAKIIDNYGNKNNYENYFASVFNEIIKNFLNSYIISKDRKINKILSIYRKNKKYLNKLILKKYIKNIEYQQLFNNFNKKIINNYVLNFFEKNKMFFENNQINNSKVYLYCNTVPAYICKEVLKYYKYNFKKIVDDYDFNNRRDFFKKIKYENSVIIICNSNIRTSRNIKKKLKNFGINNILTFAD